MQTQVFIIHHDTSRGIMPCFLCNRFLFATLVSTVRFDKNASFLDFALLVIFMRTADYRNDFIILMQSKN